MRPDGAGHLTGSAADGRAVGGREQGGRGDGSAELTSAEKVLCDAGSVSDRPQYGGVPIYLDTSVLALPEAARQLGMSATTLRHWLEGHTIERRFHEPVLRPEPTGANDLTWGEMVEADYLRAYRGKGVSMQSLRPFIQQARERFGLRYPDGPGSPVVHDPQISSAAATVAGIRTEIIREQYESGEETREIAQTFGLPINYVLAALSHEQRRHPLRLAA